MALFQLILLIIPPFLLFTYFIATSASEPTTLTIHPSLASLPASLDIAKVYPEDLFEGGAEVLLSYGKVKYWVLGPEDGQKVVLVHGLSMPSIVFKDVAPALASNGFRVLVYDLYGRGYTEAPQTTYDVNLYTTQLALLMQHLRWDRASLLGMSMGGGIVGAFVHQFPWLVERKVVLVCPAGVVDTKDLSRTTRLLSSSTIQWIASSYPVRAYMRWLANSPSTSDDPLAQIVRIQSAHLPGFNPALASSIRHGPIRGLHSSFSSPAFAQRDVLIVHGTKDRTVPFVYAKRVDRKSVV